MATRELPSRPNLDYLKKQARELLIARDGARFAAAGVVADTAKLADALHVVAREYGFASWPALKAHVESQSEQPMTALVAAIKANDADALRASLARWPDLRAQINEPLVDFGFDAPALLVAVHKESRALVEVLLEAGADVNARSRWWAGGFGVLDSAGPALAAYLLERGAVVDIHSACRLGMAERVRALLADEPALVHARGGDGQLPLHFAATVEIAAMLLDAGAALEARDVDHESTALQYMVSIKPERHEVGRYLVARGAEMDVLVAAALGDLARVRQMLDDDPDVVRVTASERFFPKTDPRAGGTIYVFGFGPGATPHMIAHRYGHVAVYELLMQRSAPWLRLVQAAELGDEALAARIVEAQPRLMEKLTPMAARRLLGPAVRNNARAVETLLGYGWPADARMENNQTALHYAAFHGNAAMTEALLRHGATVTVFETEHGGSALKWALYGSLHGWHKATGDYAGVVRLLLEAGAERPEGGVEASPEVLTLLKGKSGEGAG